MDNQSRNVQKIISIFHGRFPSEKAAALFAAQEAVSFTRKGIKTVLLVAKRRGNISHNPHKYYRMPATVDVKYLKTLDLFNTPLKKIAFYLSLLIFSAKAYSYLRTNVSENDLIYSNETLPLIFASRLKTKTMYAVHDFPEKKKWLYSHLMRKVSAILVTNQWKKDRLIEEFNIHEEKILVEPNAVNIDAFSIDISKTEARRKLKLSLDKKIVVYTGHLYSWKGANTLADASRHLPEDILVYFVGGTERDIEGFRSQYRNMKNIRMAGFRPHDEIPLWQKAADVLILPNSGKENISVHYTSPMKLFEYMASGTPIVASKLPSIYEIAGECIFYTQPDNPRKLAQAVTRALSASDAGKKSRLCRIVVAHHTWDKRSGRILDFVITRATVQ